MALRLNARRMLEDSKQEIAIAEVIFQIEDPEGYSQYRRAIDTRDPLGVYVIITDEETILPSSFMMDEQFTDGIEDVPVK